MKNLFLYYLERKLASSFHYEVTANSRLGIMRNCNISIYFWNVKVAYLYAIIDSIGDVIPVKKKGILSSLYLSRMKDYLVEELIKMEANSRNPRALFVNCIDSPLFGTNK